jgi:hypothetical protein
LLFLRYGHHREGGEHQHKQGLFHFASAFLGFKISEMFGQILMHSQLLDVQETVQSWPKPWRSWRRESWKLTLPKLISTGSCKADLGLEIKIGAESGDPNLHSQPRLPGSVVGEESMGSAPKTSKITKGTVRR